MGRSTSSCFKIMSCNGGGSAEDGDLSPDAQSKASSEKSKWSFRKKSSSHRVLSNNAISEPLSVGSSKESVEVITNNLQSSKYSSSEKPPAKERPTVTFSLPAVIVKTDEEEYATVSKENTPSFQESDAIVIQSYIRRDLARKEFKKVSSAIKVQAAVRGYLVRRQAVGTLRCVLAIVKVQALVRARQARNIAKTEYFKVKSHKSLSCSEKLLSNSFARQLLESSSATKAINIKCDPSKSDSAWKWLERWVAVSSPDLGQQQEELNECSQGVEESKFLEDEKGDEVLDDVVSLSSDALLVPSEPTMQTENTSLTTEHVNNSELKAPSVQDNSVDFSVENVVNSQAENEDLLTTQKSHTKTQITDEDVSNSLSGYYQLQGPHPTFPKFDNLESTSPKINAKNASSEILELEEKKYPQGSRKTINPAFTAAQSKFEELSSNYSASRSNGSSYQDTTVKIKSVSHNDQLDSLTKSKEMCSMDTAIFHDPRVQVASSECGTEISISSTLDSPDRSETEGGEIVLEIGALEKEKYVINSDSGSTLNFSQMESKKNDSNFESAHATEALVDRDDNLGKPIAVLADQIPKVQSPERHTHLENVTDEKVRTSPPGTPRSQTTASDFHGTPSSQVSVNTKKSKKDSNMVTQKQRSLLGGKKSPANSGNDSGGRSSVEHLPKNAKRRNSRGMAKSDSVDQEPRLSSSNSLPSYMQATVSARAKVHSNISPKLSPDVHDSNTKKRHSLPIENGQQGSSPRMQRSASQAQQNSKVNGAHSPHSVAERRWQR